MSNDLLKQYNRSGIASEYAKQSHLLLGDDPTRGTFLPQLSEMDRAKRIVDVGCGGGIDLASYRDIGFKHLVGIDMSHTQCKLAKDALGNAANVLCGGFEALPLSDKSFDILTSRYAIHYCRNVERALSEVARVVKAGGLLMVVTAHPDYDLAQTHLHNGDGTISHTLFGGKVPITYPLHRMEEYLGPAFKKYFDAVQVRPLETPSLDGAKPGDYPAISFVGRRNKAPAPSLH